MKDSSRRFLTSIVIGLFIFALFAALIIDRDLAVGEAFENTVNAKGSWPLLESAEQHVFDMLFNLYKGKDKFEGALYLELDDLTQSSLKNDELFGRWPWNRAAWVGILDYISRGHPKGIIFDILFPEPNLDDSEGVVDWPRGIGQPHGVGDLFFRNAIASSGLVYLPYLCPRVRSAPVPAEDLQFLEKVHPSLILPEGVEPLNKIAERRGEIVDEPIEAFRDGLMGYGWVDGEQDADSALRRSSLVVEHQAKKGKLLPCLALAAVLRGDEGLIKIDGNGNLFWSSGSESKLLPRDPNGHYLINWKGGLRERYPHYSLGLLEISRRLRDGEMSQEEFKSIGGVEEKLIAPEVFKDKYVVIGATIAGAHDIKETPFSPSEPGMAKHLTLLENLLRGDFMERVSQSLLLSIVFLIAVGSAMLFILSASPLRATSIMLCLALGYTALSVGLFASYDYQLDLFTPLLALITTYLVSVTWNYFFEDKKRRQVRSMFSKYMSPEIVAMLEADPELIKAGGERRELTAFFSDLANFTSLSETSEPEELLVLINEYLESMTSEIIARGGYLDKFQGDGIMAVFGVYPGESAHALKACRAAIGNQRDVKILRQRWEDEGKPSVAVRIGINSGPMVAGNVGYEGKLNYTVLGDAVNLAARLEGANKQFGTKVMLGESTYELVKDFVLTRELDILAVKGKEKGVHVYELLGIRGEDELSRQELAVLELFSMGLEKYRSFDFTEAKACFERALKECPSDGPSQTYFKRCEVFESDPPKDDWDGVFRLKSK